MDKFPERLFYRISLLAVLAAAIVIRFPYVSVERLWPDEALYAWNAQRIFHHPGLIFSREVSDFHPPLFSALLSIGHFFFLPLAACHWMVFAVNILGIIAIYLLGKKIRGPFLGVFAAISLAFNPQYFLISSLILNDGFLTVAMILFFYTLTTVDPKERISRPDVMVGLVIVVLVLLKWSAGLVLPYLFLYYAIVLADASVPRKISKAAVPLGAGVFVIAVLLVHNYAILGEWIPRVFTASTEGYQKPFYSYFLIAADILPVPFVPFFLFGLWVCLKEKNRDQKAQALWVVFAFLAVSAMSSKDARFIMPILPSIILVAGIGMDAFLCKVKEETFITSPAVRPVCLVLVFAFFVVFNLPFIEQDIVPRMYNYVGFKDAGEYLKKETAFSPDTLILASSPRLIRYFSGINFKEFGGNLSPFPETEARFIETVGNSLSDIVLVIDMWEWTQPKWVYPLNDRNTGLLKGLGFVLEKTVDKDVFVGGTKRFEKRQVIWIFRRPVMSP